MGSSLFSPLGIDTAVSPGLAGHGHSVTLSDQKTYDGQVFKEGQPVSGLMINDTVSVSE